MVMALKAIVINIFWSKPPEQVTLKLDIFFAYQTSKLLNTLFEFN